jgi:CheY-like chemotaxis protein
LVIEDSEDDFDTVEMAASRLAPPPQLVHAPDADAAARALERAAFSLVLLDINLPGTSGEALLGDIRRAPGTQLLPVVVYTTSVNPRDRDACYAAGANAYHEKCVRFDTCLETLEGIFRYWLTRVELPEPGRSWASR